MAGFLHRRANVQIQEPAFRTLHGSQNLHPDSESGGGAPQKKGSLRLRIPGRLAFNSPVRWCPETEHPHHQAPGSLAGFHHQRGKVSPRANATHTVPRCSPRLQDRKSFFDSREGPGHHRMRQSHHERTGSSSPSLDVSAGANSKPHSNPSSVPSMHEDHPASCPLASTEATSTHYPAGFQ